ncbi:Fc receptor-like protein 6 [Trachemys scripta elegans]|uniref:Fc receptor-like protein 6 n=1 Tax=Trachemys scripta elegans TaxID=31138 RepID=UPI0015577993|nr:Fc receptor-like protein 6 [Trachemys scripta elegans]
MGNQRPYTCQYWRKESGQEIPSTESNKVYITVQAPPAAPTLSLHPPHPLYLPGERVTLRCSAPGSDRLQGYRFYGEQERLIHDEVPAPAGGAGLEIVAEMGKAGPFSCAYWIPRSGRHILSERSRPVSLSVPGEASFPGGMQWDTGGVSSPLGSLPTSLALDPPIPCKLTPNPTHPPGSLCPPHAWKVIPLAPGQQAVQPPAVLNNPPPSRSHFLCWTLFVLPVLAGVLPSG